MGTDKNIFKVDVDWLFLASNSCMKNSRMMADKYNIKIYFKNDHEIISPRKNDIFFMDLIMEVTDHSNHEIWNINETRKH